MAKTAEEIKKEIKELFAELKELEPEKFNEEVDDLIIDIKEMKRKSDVSLNFEEDTIPVDEKTISLGLRNY